MWAACSGSTILCSKLFAVTMISCRIAMTGLSSRSVRAWIFTDGESCEVSARSPGVVRRLGPSIIASARCTAYVLPSKVPGGW